MRSPIKVILAACACLGMAAAGQWQLKGGDSETDIATGCGKVAGPMSLASDRWTFTASRQAIISAKPKILKSKDEAGDGTYKLGTAPARIVFLGQCEARDHKGAVVMRAPYMIFDIEEGTITGQGSGVSYLAKDGTITAAASGSPVSIDLATGEVSAKERVRLAPP